MGKFGALCHAVTGLEGMDGWMEVGHLPRLCPWPKPSQRERRTCIHHWSRRGRAVQLCEVSMLELKDVTGSRMRSE